METVEPVLPVVVLVICVAGLAVGLLIVGNLFNPRGPNPVKRMPYESGMDPIHDTRRRFGLQFYLVAVAFLVFDVELLFLYPWAVAVEPAKVATSNSRMPLAVANSNQAAATVDSAADILHRSPAGKQLLKNQNSGLVFAGAMVFLALLALGFIYDWRKGIFEWR